MVQARSIPRLTGSAVKRGKYLGGERDARVYRAKVIERTGKKWNIAEREPQGGYNKATVARYQKKWLEFKRAGLPVPDFSKVDLRKKSVSYQSIFQPNLEKKHGKLIPINDAYDDQRVRGQPTFLRRLLLFRDGPLIKSLAKDLATLHNLGYTSHFVDFWHFYRKGDSFERVIIDTGELQKRLTVEGAGHMFGAINSWLGGEEYKLFVIEYLKHIKKDTIRASVEDILPYLR